MVPEGTKIVLVAGHMHTVIIEGTCPNCDVPYVKGMYECDVCGTDLRAKHGKPYSTVCHCCGHKAYIAEDKYLLDREFYKFKCSNPHRCGIEIYVPKNSNNIEYREED